MAAQLSHAFPGELETPLHREAYPGLALRTVDAMHRSEVLLCEWHDRFDQLVGQLEIKALKGPDLTLAYSMGLTIYGDQRRLGLQVARCRMNSDRYELRAFCPACDQIKDRLFFRRQRWACQQCQKLVQRRSLLSATDKLVVEREKLLRQLHGPGSETRSALASAATRHQLRCVTDALEAAGMPMHLGYPLAYDVTQRWFASPADRSPARDPQGMPGYIDEQR